MKPRLPLSLLLCLLISGWSPILGQAKPPATDLDAVGIVNQAVEKRSSGSIAFMPVPASPGASPFAWLVQSERMGN